MSTESLFDVTSLDLEDGSVQSYRISQTLKAAGIPFNMLTDMDKARVLSALWADNTLQEDGGGMFSIFRQSGGLDDAINLDDDEMSMRNGLNKAWDKISEEQQEELKKKAKEQVDYIYQQHEIGYPMQISGALSLIVGREIGLTNEVAAKINDIDLSVFTGGISSIDIPKKVANVGTSFTPAGHDSWVDKVSAERNVPAIVKETPVKPYDPAENDGFVKTEEQRRLAASLAPKEEQLN